MKSICRYITLVLVAAMIAAPSLDAKKTKGGSSSTSRSANTVKREQKATRDEINRTRRDLEDTRRMTSRELSNLESIRADIDQNVSQIKEYQTSIDSLENLMVNLGDSIVIMETELAKLRQGYANELRQMQPSLRPMGRLAFIFGGKSIGEIYQRLRYTGEFNRWRRERSQRLQRATIELDRRHQRLSAIDASRRQALNDLNITRNTLAASERKSQNIVASLRQNEAQLQQELEERERRARNLDNELDRIIQEEQRAAAERQRRADQKKKAAQSRSSNTKPATTQPSTKPSKTASPSTPATASNSTSSASSGSAKPTTAAVTTGSFASAKGKLMSPVTGSYKIIKRFGRQQHPDLPHVTIDNPGVDFETSSGASARAVFGGVVSAIFKQDGYNTIVMVRHGDYLTIYGGLDNISVRSGETVSAGQSLGRVTGDSEGRPILHFEVRHERTKLNPLSWIN
ncbi:MAG: peptidoglycan DD-metalloendopeptidase family protein [Muribaculaceae bacterium]|nr:peptidoglycan DD-metalloendopeptidase family protein [Muribaculaceae bacterium]